VPSTRTYPTPLLQSAAYESQKGPFTVDFKKADVLKLSDEELRSLFLPANLEQPAETVLVTLMFTLNELLATSMPKTVSFLLRLTDLTQPNTLLLVVDSPGSYSTVSLGSTKSTPVSTASASARESDREETVNSERKYPLRFLLEHTLLSVASGRWECVMSEESRWFRREQTSLRYDLGDGVGLEDMRYQIHAYKRTA
jgi:25S rRNA (uracil2843-N3)-methyltransferase